MPELNKQNQKIKKAKSLHEHDTTATNMCRYIPHESIALPNDMHPATKWNKAPIIIMPTAKLSSTGHQQKHCEMRRHHQQSVRTRTTQTGTSTAEYVQGDDENA